MMLTRQWLTALASSAANRGDVVWSGNSPECRHASNVRHVCRRRDGRLLRGGEPCWHESRSQVLEEQSQMSAPAMGAANRGSAGPEAAAPFGVAGAPSIQVKAPCSTTTPS